MTEQKYFVIHCSEDGEIDVSEYTKQELINNFEEMVDERVSNFELEFMRALNEHDPQCWGDKYLIIKGQITHPIAKKIAVKFDVE